MKGQEKVFQYYNANIKSSKVIGNIALSKFIEIHKNPKDETKRVFKLIAEAAENKNLELKNKLKQKYLYYFTPCVKVKDYRKYDNITEFTGIAVLDFDKIDNAKEFKHFLFNEYRHIITAWISPSRKGVKALIQIPIVKNIQEFKKYYYGISDEMEIYDGFDSSGQNAVLPLFQAYDPGILTRTNHICWRRKGKRNNSLDYHQINAPEKIIKPNTQKEQIIINWINKGLNNINDNGHPQIRSLALTIGGYVGAGYLDINIAKQIMKDKIITHKYLSKDIRNYQKTIEWGINKGTYKPIYLKY